MQKEKIAELKRLAAKMRYDMIRLAPRGDRIHWGGCISIVEILAVLFFDILRLDPKRPYWIERDRFVLSKGHASYALYAAMANRGFFDVEKLAELDKNGGSFPKHADRLLLSGIEVSCGALGQGLSVACGMALAAKLDKRDTKIYCLIGDGECSEGQIWEAAQLASKYYLSNLLVIVDNNRMTLDERVSNVMPPLKNLTKMWRSFGWNTLRVSDGHDVEQLSLKIRRKKSKSSPSVLIAETIKGKGVSFMEDRHEWHVGALSEEETRQALEEIRMAHKNAGGKLL